MPNDQPNIFLVGPMGSGKSTIGARLAGKMGLEFFDCDREIESRTGASVKLIFEIEGETGFRERESRMLEELSGKKGVLVATGGGAVVREENRTLLRRSGIVVYLRASVDQQMERLRRDHSRPLLQTDNKENTLSELAEVRNPLYEEVADLVFPVRNRNIEGTVSQINNAIRDYCRRKTAGNHQPQACGNSDMETLEVRLKDASYPVYLGHGILGDGTVWRHHLGQGKALIVTNETVAPLYLDSLQTALMGHATSVCILPDGEPHKTLESWASVIDQLVGFGARRDATIIALGGGVIGDISGFAAASYMRGIRFLQVPTTLLAQVDASVGGKTGVNHQAGKNLIGAFHQPAAVIIDTATLMTLPEREYRAGLAEVVKYGAIMDPALFDWLWKNSEDVAGRQDGALQHMVQRSVLNKSRIVGADERESGIRAILNFGHTFGHAIETVTGYTRFLHGEAVAIGMVMAARLSEMRGLCPEGTAIRMVELLRKLGLPVELPGDIDAREITHAMGLDKKALTDGSRLILLKTLGEAVIDASSTGEDILAAVMLCRQPSPLS